MMKSRLVALVDMDCFYAQVEQRLNPDLKGKPVAVVQYKTWRGGGIIAVNYEARKFGVTRNMRGDEAKAKCPDIALVRVPENRDKADITKYRDAGREVIDVLCQFSNCVERASIDEAYIDLTSTVDQRMSENSSLPSPEKLSNTFIVGYESHDSSADEEHSRALGVAAWLSDVKENSEGQRLAVAALLVEEMRAAVLEQTGFTCSAGVAHNKTLSKLVCGLHKPARQTVLPVEKIPDLYSTLPIKKVRSLGGKLGENLVQVLGVTVMADLERFSEAELIQKFDQKNGSWLYNIARGIDNDPVNARLIPKSIGCCKRFPGQTALGTQQDVDHWLNELAKEVAERLAKDLNENRRRARGLTVQWCYDIGSSSCSKTGVLTSYEAQNIAAEAGHLLSKADTAPVGTLIWKPPLQFLGIFVSKFTEEENKAASIEKFFKPVTKNEKPSTTKSEVDKNASESTSTEKTSKSEVEKNTSESNTKKASKLKSFFLNYAKNVNTQKADNCSENVNDQDTSKERDIVSACEFTTISDLASEQAPEMNEVKPHDDASTSAPSTSDDSRSPHHDAEAPCPQCEKLVLISEMSSHLDHHVAEELHLELNRAPIRPPVVMQPGPTKKRKYTKASTKTSNVKTKKIDSFFS